MSGKTDYWRLIEGIIFVAVIVFLPGGILGTFKRKTKASREILTGSLRTAPPDATPVTNETQT